VERAHLLTKQAEALGEPPEDPLLLFSVLYGSYLGNYHALNVEMTCKLAEQFLTLAENSGATFPRVVGHDMMGASLLLREDLVQSLAHCNQAIALYAPAEHRPLATRFSIDHGVGALAKRSQPMWMLGYPDAAIVNAERALKEAREIGHAITLMYALRDTFPTHVLCGSYGKVSRQTDELVALADEKAALSFSMLIQGGLFAQTRDPSDAVQRITRGATAWRSGGSTVMPIFLSYLALAHVELGQFDDAQRCVGEAITTVEATNARLWEAEVHRTAGEIALKSSVTDTAKAEAYFERALAIAREQKAKSWELRAAMSLARLWRNQGERDQARDLLAPVYGWFTEGHDTLDLKDAKALLDELAR
jgi:predicted ATPase